MDPIGRFQPEHRFGGAKYSEVFLCRDGDRRVVVKRFRIKRRELKRIARKGDTGRAEGWRQQFTDEANLAASFRHPNIVQVLENSVLPDGAPYFVMPYLPSNLATEIWGSPLPQKTGQPLEQARAVTVLRQLLSALAEMHARGVVHRDVKPQNVLFDGQGKAVIIDFGHARNPTAEAPPKKKGFGTPPFISPEQRDDPEAVDGRADIYSLGVMAYLMLTGLRPEQDPQPPNLPDPTIDAGLGDWVMRAIDADPARRPTAAASAF